MVCGGGGSGLAGPSPLRAWAERKAGEMLGQLERRPGERTDVRPSNSPLQGSAYAATLEETGTNRMTAHRWQTIAAVPVRAWGLCPRHRAAVLHLPQRGPGFHKLACFGACNGGESVLYWC